MTTSEFNTSITELVNTLLESSNIYEAYQALSDVDPETLVTTLTGSNISSILTMLEEAGVSSEQISEFETIASNFATELVSMISQSDGGLTYNINGNSSNLSGSDSNDALINIDADDSTLDGNAGDDLLLNIGSGNNSLSGDAGNDMIANLGTGNNTLDGGDDSDTLLNIGTGNNTLNGGNGTDILINAGTGSNILNGGSGADTLINFGSGASLNGGNGADVLIGGNSDDALVGGSGYDVLTGGDGADTFTVSLTTKISFSWLKLKFGWSTSGKDTISDFNSTEGDVIQLDVTDLLGQFNSGSLSFDSTTGTLSYGSYELATLEGVTNFDVSNIQII